MILVWIGIGDSIHWWRSNFFIDGWGDLAIYNTFLNTFIFVINIIFSQKKKFEV
jgi:hypothetical protein